MEILLQLYVDPLRRQGDASTARADDEDVSDLLTPAEVNAMFSNVDQILGINTALLEALTKDQSLGSVAAALREMAAYLKARL